VRQRGPKPFPVVLGANSVMNVDGAAPADGSVPADGRDSKNGSDSEDMEEAHESGAVVTGGVESALPGGVWRWCCCTCRKRTRVCCSPWPRPPQEAACRRSYVRRPRLRAPHRPVPTSGAIRCAEAWCAHAARGPPLISASCARGTLGVRMMVSGSLLSSRGASCGCITLNTSARPHASVLMQWIGM